MPTLMLHNWACLHDMDMDTTCTLSIPGPSTRDVDYTTFAMQSLQTSNKCVGITGASDVFLSMSETANSNEPACSHKYQTRTLRFHEAAFSQGMEKKTVTA